MYYLCSQHKGAAQLLSSCAVTEQLICGFAFAYAKIQFSHDAAQIIMGDNSTTFFTVLLFCFQGISLVEVKYELLLSYLINHMLHAKWSHDQIIMGDGTTCFMVLLYLFPGYQLSGGEI